MFMMYRTALNARSFTFLTWNHLPLTKLCSKLKSQLGCGINGSVTDRYRERDSLWYVTMRLCCLCKCTYFMQVILIHYPFLKKKEKEKGAEVWRYIFKTQINRSWTQSHELRNLHLWPVEINAEIKNPKCFSLFFKEICLCAGLHRFSKLPLHFHLFFNWA